MRTIALLIPLLLLCCSSLRQPSPGASMGIIGFEEKGAIRYMTDLEVPDTVDLGATFQVRFSTFGPTTAYQADESIVEVSGVLAEITPYGCAGGKVGRWEA